jgi:hypothetical protein
LANENLILCNYFRLGILELFSDIFAYAILGATAPAAAGNEVIAAVCVKSVSRKPFGGRFVSPIFSRPRFLWGWILAFVVYLTAKRMRFLIAVWGEVCSPAWMIFGTPVAVAFGTFLGAFIVQFATNRVAGFKPRYGRVLLASFSALAVASVMGIVILFATDAHKEEWSVAATALLLVVSFLSYAVFYSFMLKSSDGVALGFGKACLVLLMQSLIVILAFILLKFIIWVASSLW